MSFRWIFSDATESYTFEVNPNDGGSPAAKKNLTYKATTARGGNLVITEGRDLPRVLEFSGTLLSQSQYQTFVHWLDKAGPITLTDDLGRSGQVVLTEFVPARKRTRHFDWRHGYTIRGYYLP
jgi:hypothetical protein